MKSARMKQLSGCYVRFKCLTSVRWFSIEKTAVGLLLCFLLTGGAIAREAVQEYIFLIDTSASMNSKKLVAPLRVAVDDFADTIPIDSSSRIWIFTFDNGLRAKFLQRVIGTAKDLEDAKIFMSSLEF